MSLVADGSPYPIPSKTTKYSKLPDCNGGC